MEIVRLVNGFMTYHNRATKEKAIFYQPTAYSGDYFEGIIQRSDYSIYADGKKNTLQVLPAFGEDLNEERMDFLHALDKLTLPHNNNYFTSGFLTLGLTLRDSKLIYYGIDSRDYRAQIMPYEYDCESDTYALNENLKFTIQDSFLREATKEAVFRKYESGLN